MGNKTRQKTGKNNSVMIIDILMCQFIPFDIGSRSLRVRINADKEMRSHAILPR